MFAFCPILEHNEHIQSASSSFFLHFHKALHLGQEGLGCQMGAVVA